MQIDLNADLGESFGSWSLGDDDAMLELVTSANVACGFHAGDPTTLRETCAAAVAAIRQGWMDSPLQLELPGGKLSIEWAGPGQPVMMTGPAVRVYEGQVRL